MNYIRKKLFLKKIKNLQKKILLLSGYFNISVEEKKLIALENNTWYKTLNEINVLYHDFKLIKFEEEEAKIYKVLFMFFQAKQLLLFGELHTALIFIKETNQLLHESYNTVLIEWKEWMLLNLEFMEIQINNSLWIKSIETYFITAENKINFNNKIIEECNVKYELYEKNTLEYLQLSAQHLEATVEIALLNNQKQNKKIVPEEYKKEGEVLLIKLNYFINKDRTSPKDILFKSLLLLEKAKLNFYLENSMEENFTNIANFCKMHIQINSNDPIGYAIGIFWPLIIQEEIINFETSFKNYLNSFHLEIFINSSKNNETLFNLKQINNFKATNINQRLKINNIKEV